MGSHIYNFFKEITINVGWLLVLALYLVGSAIVSAVLILVINLASYLIFGAPLIWGSDDSNISNPYGW